MQAPTCPSECQCGVGTTDESHPETDPCWPSGSFVTYGFTSTHPGCCGVGQCPTQKCTWTIRLVATVGGGGSCGTIEFYGHAGVFGSCSSCAALRASDTTTSEDDTGLSCGMSIYYHVDVNGHTVSGRTVECFGC